MINAENYDLGGASIDFSDATAGNSGNELRLGDVDINVALAAGQQVMKVVFDSAGRIFSLSIT